MFYAIATESRGLLPGNFLNRRQAERAAELAVRTNSEVMIVKLANDEILSTVTLCPGHRHAVAVANVSRCPKCLRT